jgi:Flp pilus assembly protein protease CpaA
LLAWLGNPLTALLALPALHLWLGLADPRRLDIGRLPRRAVSLALVALGLAPLLLLVLFYAHQLGLGAGDVAWMGVLLLAAGHVGVVGAILWSGALGCFAAAALVALDVLPTPIGVPAAEAVEVTIRGPLSYAGPGSLGGTESALRR